MAIVPSSILKQGVLDALPQILEASPARLDLVDLVDEDDALLGNIEIAVGCLDQPGKQDSQRHRRRTQLRSGWWHHR